MIVFSCGLITVPCISSRFFATIVFHKHFLQSLELAPIVNDNKLRLWVRFKPGVMKNPGWILLTYLWL
jgi:hypothetical protein